ncbi:MAG: CBS domain-containing protein [Alphaproteobacteria bacterium]|nr:CBS domain-containing protein [Alphaproteobacteria bacterium]
MHQCLLSPDASIQEAIEKLEVDETKIVLVVDAGSRLLGTVTDGDIRRGILRRVPLDAPVSEVINVDPVVAQHGETAESLLSLMKARHVRQIPLIDQDLRVVGLETIAHLEKSKKRENMVLLMAGGFGRRLLPLTENAPKPMVEVGSQPILQTIIKTLSGDGFENICIAVHYRAQDIMRHFGDGSEWGVRISYIEETTALGTAGALGLLPERPSLPFIVMNGDILTDVNFDQLLDFHADHMAKGTICVRDYDFQVPYGIVQAEEHRFSGIVEKPVHKFLVNAGIYVLDPSVLDALPEGGSFDMPSLFQTLRDKDENLVVFPIREYWADIGRMEDLERARVEFDSVFKK